MYAVEDTSGGQNASAVLGSKTVEEATLAKLVSKKYGAQCVLYLKI